MHWYHMEGTGGKDSGKTEPESNAQAASYTAFNLQARPDLRSVVGIFVKATYFNIFASDACRVYQTNRIP